MENRKGLAPTTFGGARALPGLSRRRAQSDKRSDPHSVRFCHWPTRSYRLWWPPELGVRWAEATGGRHERCSSARLCVGGASPVDNVGGNDDHFADARVPW